MPSFQEVLKKEREYLRDQARDAKDTGTTFGLAISGGGIRSATFGLGVLQGLAQAKLLSKIKYISTVSGGGYIGGWLVSWINRAPGRLEEVENKLGNYENSPDEDGAPEPKQINFLRDYSNYLTPRKGIFGGDTWAAIATYLRNVLLNQVILIAFLGAVLLIPWLVGSMIVWLGKYVGDGHHERHIAAWVAAAVAMGFLFWAIAWAAAQTARCSIPIKKGENTSAPEKWVILAVGLPLFLSASFTLTALWLWHHVGDQALWRWAVIGGVAYAISHLIGLAIRIRISPAKAKAHSGSSGAPTGRVTWPQRIGIPLSALGAGAIGGLLLWLCNLLVACWRSWGADFGGTWHAVGGGPPLLVVAFLLVGGFHIGLLKLLIAPEEQEWWGRLGGLLLLGIIVWAAIFGLAIFAPYFVPPGVQWAKTKITVTLVWIATTAFGLISGKSSQTSGRSDGNPKLEVAALVSPYIFILGLLVLLSLGAHRLAVWTAATAAKPYWAGVQEVSPPFVLFWFVILAVLAVLLAYRVDINIFSMNLLYRNRLVRCYLGASRIDGRRQPNRFTGFDPADDPFLTDFDNDCLNRSDKSQPYRGPYPIVCAALNVTHGERLAWQERKAESFVFTPKFCGYEFPEMRYETDSDAVGNTDAPQPGFRDTETYAYPKSDSAALHADRGGVHLGTAISISGAAASPNMGYHTSPPLAFLMTVFDVRLGWWLPNSRYSNDQLPTKTPEGGPPCSLMYLLFELAASTTDQSKYVYLSDGGHFENLAVYELVRRRTPYIIACDGDADEGMTFGDLGNAIRKCRSDFGVEISIDPSPIKLPAGGFARLHGAVGKIHYPRLLDGTPAFDGDILYIKPTITAQTPRDVLSYRETNPPFPDQTTADQWFDESQFESYRRLGLHSFRSLAGIGGPESERITVEQLFEYVGMHMPR